MAPKVRGFEKVKGCKMDVKMPERATKHSAGYDFYSAEDKVIPSLPKVLFKAFFQAFAEDEPIEYLKSIKDKIKPSLIKTNVKSYMQDGEVLMLYNRSSNPIKKGIVLANGVGCVDKDYYSNKDNDGNIMFQFWNILPFDIEIKRYDKLGQGVFHKFLIADNDNADGDRDGGFGSTDKK